MFDKYFQCRFTGSKQTIQKNTKGADINRVHINLVYDFDGELAASMGPRAEGMQAQLLAEKDVTLTAKSIGIELGADAVKIEIQHKGATVLTVERTLAISATANKPTASSETPSIKVELIAAMTEPLMGFCGEFLGQGVEVKLTEQGTLPLEGVD